MALPGLSFEIVRSSGPVLGIRADRTAMLALTERGPEEVPTLVHSPNEFLDLFGTALDGMLGPLAAEAYFKNGGAELIVTRIVPRKITTSQPDAGFALAGGCTLGVVGATEPSFELIVQASDRGAYANRISVEALLGVRKRARGTVTADDTIVFDNLLGPLFQATDVDLPVRGLGRQTALPHAATEHWGRILSIADDFSSVPGTQTVKLTAPATAVFAGDSGLAVLELYEPTFTLKIREPGRADLSIAELDLRDLTDANAKLSDARITLSSASPAPTDPELPVPGVVTRLSGGADGIADFANTDALDALHASFLRALEALELSDLPDVVIAPDLWSRVFRTKGVFRLAFDAATAIELADEMVQSAERTRDRVVLLDPPLGGTDDLRPFGVEELERWRTARENALLTARDFTASYTPWVRIVAGPVFKGDDTLLVPPSPFVAGQMALTARDRGPWIATGNVPLQEVVGLEQTLSLDDEQRLQDIGLNPLRMVLPRGATIQGVRSLSWPDRKPWRFLSTRRLFNFLRRALEPIGLSYVFEPNSPATWITLRRDIERLLRDMYARGAFAGSRPEDAFFVKIDDQLNPEDARANGILTGQIGVAPAFPLEFLVVRLILGRGVVEVTEEPIVR